VEKIAPVVLIVVAAVVLVVCSRAVRKALRADRTEKTDLESEREEQP
jgi:flagellar biosynthesis/type III secretory pathway M-ring protein FliF/YscJ